MPHDNIEENLKAPTTIITNLQEPRLVTDPDHPKQPKKRLRKPEEWTRNIKKKARLQGRELLDENGAVLVRSKPMRDMDCSCGCSNVLSEDEKEFVYEQFRSKATHSLQNEYLRGCTSIVGIEFFGNGKFNRVFKHVLRFNFKTVEVCQNYFLGIHGIKRSRLRNQVLRQEVDIDDKRGKHSNHRVVTNDHVRDQMRVFLASLPARSSHYSQNDNPNRRYLDSDETVVSLFDQFFKTFPEITREQAKLPVFRLIFNTEFNIAFGEPRTDKCATCEKIVTDIKNAKLCHNDEQVAELERDHDAHLETSQIFYNDYGSANELPDDHFVICFDFQKNFPLPSTEVNKEYFISQLWICNFGIRNLRTGESTMFVYSEHYAKKGANEVITCLTWYIREIVPPDVRHLHLYCDNAYGQNKNRYLLAVLQNLANKRFDNVYLRFPVPGHSRMPIDGDFGRITSKRNNIETLSYPSDVVRIIENAQKEKPFNIVYVNSNLTDDLCDDGRVVLDVKDFKSALENSLLTPQRANLNFQLSREFLFQPQRAITVNFSDRFLHPKREIVLFKEWVTTEKLEEIVEAARSAYDNFLPISEIKLKNVEELTQYVASKPGLTFYSTLYSVVGGARMYYNAKN